MDNDQLLDGTKSLDLEVEEEELLLRNLQHLRLLCGLCAWSDCMMVV